MAGDSTRFSVPAEEVRPLAAIAGRAMPPTSGAMTVAAKAELDYPAEGQVPLADYFRLLEQLAGAAQDETFRLSSRPLMPGSNRFIWSTVAAADNLAEAMRTVAKSYNLLHGGHYNRVETRRDALVYIIDDRGFPYAHTAAEEAHRHLTVECLLIFLHSMLALFVEDDLTARLRKVYSRREEDPQRGGHLRVFGVPVRWGAPVYGLAYSLGTAALAVRAPQNAERIRSGYGAAIDFVERRDCSARSRSLSERVHEALEAGQDQPRIGHMLGMSVATLRRRLEAEGVGFRQLRRDSLNARAQSMLTGGAHPRDVAEELGFSDLRSFNRAFKAWNGVTPQWFRSRRKG